MGAAPLPERAGVGSLISIAKDDAVPVESIDIIVSICRSILSGKCVSIEVGLPGRMSSDEYHAPIEGSTGQETGKTAASSYNRPPGDSTVRPVSTARKRPSLQTQKLVLAALRLWELKNGYRR
jgi:hypothetical protein